MTPEIIAWRVGPLGPDGNSRIFKLHVSPDAAVTLTGALSSPLTLQHMGRMPHAAVLSMMGTSCTLTEPVLPFDCKALPLQTT